MVRFSFALSVASLVYPSLAVSSRPAFVPSRPLPQLLHRASRQRCSGVEVPRETAVHETELPQAEETAPSLGSLSPLMLTAASLFASPGLALAQEQGAYVPEASFDPKSFWLTCFLYFLCLPGFYSVMKRTVKSKDVDKTFSVPLEQYGGVASVEDAIGETRQMLAEHFRNFNWELRETQGESLTYTGLISRNIGVVWFLTFCGLIVFGSLSLVMIVVEQAIFGVGNGLGNLWWLSVLLGPLAGKYHWDNGTRYEMVTATVMRGDEGKSVDVRLKGMEDEIERLRGLQDWCEKGKERIEGLIKIRPELSDDPEGGALASPPNGAGVSSENAVSKVEEKEKEKETTGPAA
uniref:Uncharacterized protein n=1 Tax=Chromera velia CCMP2878 TaxID=1169474 RepID=A0A0G4H0Y0_9ALVE|mmetsp:Transcript_49411/g.97339  ORF Transcript_49411/g.97339 Transcript_49411/m.97339 type:complete len:349 (-) Transcript_49411:337-1383(-)|eukprot:Cvel_24199.t1-p1 / transcript=Cvel_24199.t1 / gene=Cvel_24199 / organism=Chromera_velia_CCMP2878 / gene_product=hypothetical protein / transcript_product=hypothetical protein / location=Cvel_scaffold2585:4857-7137(+) / protein_length=348 / sequence_SO=supercontig / SO=protein_coding / is_pseudo=false